MLDDLRHRWHQPDPVGNPTWWECSACPSGFRGGAPSEALCPDLVQARIQALERAMGDLLDLEPEMSFAHEDKVRLTAIQLIGR